MDNHPSVRQISPGSLYLYDREFNDEIAKLNAERKKLTDNKDADNAEALKKLDGQIQYFRDSLTKAVLDAMAKKAADVRATKPEEPFIRALTEQAGNVPVTHLFFRGDHGQPKAAVKPADLSVVALNKNPIPENDARRPSTGRRLALAKRLTDGTHPLTGRVLVNRFWLHHFGRGLVEPIDDHRATNPASNEKLLDALSIHLRRTKYDLKAFTRTLLASRAYQLSSEFRDQEQFGLHEQLVVDHQLRRITRRIPRKDLRPKLDQRGSVLASERAHGRRAHRDRRNRYPSH